MRDRRTAGSETRAEVGGAGQVERPVGRADKNERQIASSPSAGLGGQPRRHLIRRIPLNRRVAELDSGSHSREVYESSRRAVRRAAEGLYMDLGRPQDACEIAGFARFGVSGGRLVSRASGTPPS